MGGDIVSRRAVLALAASAAAGAGLAACGGASTATDPQIRFRSRPDLRPPVVTVNGPHGPTGGGYNLITPAGPLIVDDAGQPVWYRPVKEAATNLKMQRYRGQPVLSWWEGAITKYGTGKGRCHVYDTAYRPVAHIGTVNGLDPDLHELVIADDGTAYVTAYRKVPADLRAVGGPRAGTMLDSVVLGVDLATGAVVFEWHSAAHIAPSETYTKYSADHPFDPVHLNSVAFTADGQLLLSARNTWALYKIERTSGRILWRLGGKRSDFALGKGARFAWQHDARPQPDGTISLFDDEAKPKEAAQSRGLVLRVDEAARTASVRAAYRHPRRGLLAGSQGSVQLLQNGDVFVGWGADPYFTQYHADGAVVLDAHIEKGTSYRATRALWHATAPGRPALAVQRDGGASVACYVSWNGATDVAAWRIVGGRSEASLAALHVAPRDGFETRTVVPTPPAVVAAQALDAHGNVLAISAPAHT